ncbi:MAG: ABC transporter permease [Holosporales bacterium]|jgi:phospholipid/cholesterol/gamma-HCH transport system permease protein|nr:ABC transporter permease [Holosporales bacterium]
MVLVFAIRFLEKIGQVFISFLNAIGDVGIFLFNSLLAGIRPPYYWKQIAQQSLQIGYFSLPVVGMTALFTGIAMALQCYVGFSEFTAEAAIPSVVLIAMTRELGPVLTALMVAGRLGASMTAEIGTMRVTEQIDALTTLSVNSHKYLVFPRLLTGSLLLPFLVFVDDVIGILGGYIVGVYYLGFNSSNYIHNTFTSMNTWDVISGLLKGAAFGFTICLMGCYHGYASQRGAEGVGRATTNSVVASSILILLLDCILTFFLF